MPLTIAENEIYESIIRALETNNSVVITNYHLTESTKRMLSFKGITMLKENGEIIAKKTPNGIIGTVM